MFVWEFDRQKSELVCKHCDKQGTLEKYSKPPHMGTRCTNPNCMAWNEWLRQTPEPPVHQEDLHWPDPPTKEKPPRYTPNQIAHPQTLAERVASLEHDLAIIAQIVLGKRTDG